MTKRKKHQKTSPSSSIQNQQIVKSIRSELVREIRAEFFAGPLPAPEVLIKYNEAVPNAAERILSMAENQSRHRQDLETTAINSEIQTRKRGQTLGFILGLTTILGGFYLLYIGKSVAGMGAILTAAGTLIGVFVYGSKQRERERIQKYGNIIQGKNNRRRGDPSDPGAFKTSS